jgi:hypothetical protein
MQRIQRYVARHQDSDGEGKYDAVITLVARRPGRCPEALRPGPNPPGHVLSALRREIPRLYRPPTFHIKHYSVRALFSLDRTAEASAATPQLHTAPFSQSLYRRKAAAACGATVATRSWLAVMEFPGAAMATLSPALAYLARTHRGWKVWYQWNPNLSKPAFPGE